MRSKRLFVLCIAAAVVGNDALAGPLEDPVLRGSVYERPAAQPRFVPGYPVVQRWDGLYIGGHAGYSNSSVSFSGGVADLVANLLRNTTVQAEFSPSNWVHLPEQGTTRPSYGGFIGYNAQFEDSIVGVEFSYNRTDIRMASGDTIARVVATSDGYANSVTLSGTSSIHLTDYATLRARYGWVYKNVVPYAFVGAAVAHGTVSRSASVSVNGVDADPACVGPPNVCLPPFFYAASESDNRERTFAFGWTFGTGIDWMLFSNVFLRGEYEYVGLSNFYGAKLSIQTARAGAGIKF